MDPDVLDKFSLAAESLKKYRRATIENKDGYSLIDELYVDPLSNNAVLNKVLRPNTTVLIGRRGTGKSTIFQKVQSTLLQKKDHATAYIDIKSIYETSRVEFNDVLSEQYAALSGRKLQELLVFRQFFKDVISEIKSELNKRLNNALWEKIKEVITAKYADLFIGLDQIIQQLDKKEFVDAVAMVVKQGQGSVKIQEKDASLIGASGSGLTVNVSGESLYGRELTENYSEILVRIFNIHAIIREIKALLEKMGIRHLYVLIDDFSELPEDAMRMIVDVLIAPLNNSSDEFVKFKIAAYPGRVYLGKIDNTKIDEIYLDLFNLYGSQIGSDIPTMEEAATRYTQRIIENRMQHFCKNSFVEFISKENEKSIWKSLFYASMANPRILGHLLQYLHDRVLVEGGVISENTINHAAMWYYEEKVKQPFVLNRFQVEDFRERSSVFGLKELLELMVSRSIFLRSHDNKIMNSVRESCKFKTIPTSHFYVLSSIEKVLSTLELNFFITKYGELKHKDGNKISLFAFNYGLCRTYKLRFGRPIGEREFKDYFRERVFDYTPIVESYMKTNVEIVCDNCGKRWDLSDQSLLERAKMRCLECLIGTCNVINNSAKYQADLLRVGKEANLNKREISILVILYSCNSKDLSTIEISEEMDCTYQSIVKPLRKLTERGLLDQATRDFRQYYKLSGLALKSYFGEENTRLSNLDVDADEALDVVDPDLE